MPFVFPRKRRILKDSTEGMYAKRERENCIGLGGRGREIANKREIGLAPKANLTPLRFQFQIHILKWMNSEG